MSTDPALQEGKYFPKPGDYDTEHDFYWYILNDASGKLPGMGGVYNAVNLDLYNYVGNNPIIYIDPDGQFRFGKRPLAQSIMVKVIATAIMLMFAPQDVNITTLDKMNIEAIHEHGFYDDSNENIGYSNEGFMDKENKNNYSLEKTIYDDILMKKAEENVMKKGNFDKEGKKYKLIGNNCQDFADAMREEYNKLYSNLDTKGKKEVDARVEKLRQRIQQEEKKK